MMKIDAAPDISHRLLSNAAAVRKALDDTLTEMTTLGIDSDVTDTAQIILGEVLNNVVEHAYATQDGHPIDLTISARRDGLWCEIHDEGKAMPNGVPPDGVMPELDLSVLGVLPEGGFGWAMVRELTEDIRYTRRGQVNRLTFLIPNPKA